jgi:hypothetical protein
MRRGKVMTCPVSSDLDNFGRLSCLWVVEGQQHRAPGLEGIFRPRLGRAALVVEFVDDSLYPGCPSGSN